MELLYKNSLILEFICYEMTYSYNLIFMRVGIIIET